MEKWSDAGIGSHCLEVIERMGFEKMTPVQIATIPLFLKNKDVAVEAVTGSGKTLAFVIPIIEMLTKKNEDLKKHDVFSLIISPTRELASQISEVIGEFLCSKASHFTQMLIIGGTGDISKDTERFEELGAHIVVGTPGRINSVFENSKQFCSAVRSLETLVLDEADRLLDLGFHQTLSSILSYLPKQRRTGLFSATQTEETEKLLKAGLRNPVRIIVKQKLSNTEDACVRTPTTLKNYYLVCKSRDKFGKLISFLKCHKKEKVLVFFSTCAAVDYFGRAIKEFFSGCNISLLHGKMKKKRLQIFSDFKEKESGVLVCTDVMARGVDIPEVNWVLQFDPPSSASAFVHRCGRTARIGKQGNALIFLLENERAYVDFMEINQKAPIYEYKDDFTAADGETYLDKLRNLGIKDRAMMECGTRAFVSFVKSYAKHECSLIFRLKGEGKMRHTVFKMRPQAILAHHTTNSSQLMNQLATPYGFRELATGFALLQLPKMPELKGRKVVNFQPSDVNINEVKYKDKYREKARRLALEKYEREKPEVFARKRFVNNKSWSKNKERRDKKLKRRECKDRKRKLKEANTFDDKELEELQNDSLLVKKLKKGKITQEEFDEKMKMSDL